MVFKVPTREVAVQNIGTAPISSNNVRASADAFGAGVGRAVEGVGGQLSQSANQMANIALEQQDKKNVTQAVDSYRAFSDDWRKQDALFKSKQGLDADGITEEATKIFGELSSKYEQNLGNGARERFKALADGSRESALNGMSRHEATQAEAAYKNQMGALAQTAVSEIIANPMDAENVARNRVILDTAVRAQNKGQDKDVIDIALKTNHTIMHNSIIDQLMLTSPDAAKEYYDKNKDEIFGEQRIKIEQKIQIAADNTTAQAYADEAVNSDLTETEALAGARKEYSGTTEKAVVSEIKLRYAENDEKIRREAIQLEKDGWKIISEGGSPNDFTPTMLQALDPRKVDSMRQFAVDRAQRGSGYAEFTDPKAYNELHLLYMNDKLAFSGAGENALVLERYKGRMTEADYEYWGAQQRSIDKAGEKELAKKANYGEADKIAKLFMTSNGIDYGKNASGEDPASAQKIYSLGWKIVDDALAEGRQPTRKELEMGIATLFISGEIGGTKWFENNDFSYYELVGTGKEPEFYLTNEAIKKQLGTISTATGVPQENIPTIVNWLRENKRMVSPENIFKAYKRGFE